MPRPQLIDRLDEGLQQGRKVSIVSAPAGYGKTTIAVEWVRRLIEREINVAWLSLDQGDNDPDRFWAYLLSSLQSIPQFQHDHTIEAALQILTSSKLPNIDNILIDLINESLKTNEPICLVLDDLHLIQERAIHQGLNFLIEKSPSMYLGFHIMITTRQDPPWPMARYRSKAILTEIRAHDLRFNIQETTSFLNNVMQLDLSSKNIADLDDRTEGWIAGLQMAAISMQGRRGSPGGQGVSEFIQSLTGSHRYVLDFLVEEVLQQQSQVIQEFLYKTSILQRLTASLCDAVLNDDIKPTDGFIKDLPSGRMGSQIHLNYLEQANLFLNPLDDTRNWYRYHPLFADLLQKRLKLNWPDQLVNLHLRASAWYEANGWLAEAIYHAIQANDIPRIANLVEANAFSILDQGGMESLKRWLKMIPTEVSLNRPWLSIARSWVLVYDGQMWIAEKLLQQIEDLEYQLPDEETDHLSGHINAIRGYAAWIEGDGLQAAKFARKALNLLADDDLSVRALTGNTLTQAYIQNSDLVGAYQIAKDALFWGRASKNSHAYMLVSSGLAYLLILQGRLDEAESVCQAALAFNREGRDLIRRNSPAVAQVYAMLSNVYLYRYLLEQAIVLAQKGVEISKQWAQADTLTLSYVYLADALITYGDLDGASTAIKLARDAGSHVSGWFDAIIRNMDVSLHLKMGDLNTAIQLIGEKKFIDKDQLRQPDWSTYRLVVRILIAYGKYHEAFDLLNIMIEVITDANGFGYLVGLYTLQAIVLEGLGKHIQALEALKTALALAEPGQFIRPFLTAGASLRGLLQQLIVNTPRSKFAEELLGAIENDSQVNGSSFLHEKGADRDKSPESEVWLSESLTFREMDVLRLLNSSLSVPEIAQELFVQPSTVRTHIRNIYSKLNAHSRLEAVHRAKGMGLI